MRLHPNPERTKTSWEFEEVVPHHRFAWRPPECHETTYNCYSYSPLLRDGLRFRLRIYFYRLFVAVECVFRVQFILLLDQ